MRLLILIALSMGSFAIGTSEFVIMGLLPEVARGLAITEQQVGHLISAYALGVVIGAPVLAILGSRLKRKTLLVALMLFYGVANLASAMVSDYHGALLARFISGLPHGAYFGVAALAAAAISPLHKRGAAVSAVMMGLTLAILIGNPLATWLGQILDWRYAFVVVAVIAGLTSMLVYALLPGGPKPEASSVRGELKAFFQPQIGVLLLIASVGFAGMFCVFSYLAPTLLQVTGASPNWIPAALASFGAGAVLGNIVGGRLFDRYGVQAIGIVLVWSIVVMLAFPLAAQSIWTLLPGIACVGTMIALGPVLQTRLMDIAKGAQTLAAASNHAAFNLANALGPWLGGMAIAAGWGWTSTGFVGATTALLGLLVYVAAVRGKTAG
ncbi:MFS transporter [Pseudomonas sp. 21LCFQ02]|uniref:MFS transporter n=1 Tax=unclassified Pseudomonas TaxID=196821 RepID=UPI0005EE96F6|nr:MULTISPECIES: MFS transporter [unclassified Pseudomonas]MCO8165211.1 MFS transporter [Pseudomonas sp. 21LCFQ010]MCO8171358.1 MFS transporter [Pseudomonas sp. 21LCFQ02]MCQ9427103.1 MFS transporter [Pseudomonas sp. LJDD11]